MNQNICLRGFHEDLKKRRVLAKNSKYGEPVWKPAKPETN